MGLQRRPTILLRGSAVWLVTIGAAIYFRCAWEFAARGLGTPAPIAPTKYLVTTALHRYIRNPMYVGVFLVLLGEAVLFHAGILLAYTVFFCLPVDRTRNTGAKCHAGFPSSELEINGLI
jgi:protein-S-isoprenylcysteine O-methyltransferase Ste14